MCKKAVLLGFIGYVIGCVIGLCFTLQYKDFSIATALPHIVLGGIPGAVIMSSTVIYDIEEWSILRATATHFLFAMGVLVFACFALKWFKPWSAAFWIMLAAEVVCYILIWLIMYSAYKAKVRKLNMLLKEGEPEEKK